MVEEISFERIHRMPTKRADETSNAPRPIIAKFSFFQHKEHIWRYVRNLKGTSFGVANDYPKEIDDIRKAVYPAYKNTRKNLTATLGVDRVIIQGNVYRGEETKKFPLHAKILHPTEWSFWLSSNNWTQTGFLKILNLKSCTHDT